MTHNLQPNELPTFESPLIKKSRKFHIPTKIIPDQNIESFCDCCSSKNDENSCNNSLTNQWHDCGIAERLFKKFTPEIIVKLCDNAGFETLIRHEDYVNGGVRIILDIQPKLVKQAGEIKEIMISVGGEKVIKKIKNVRTHVRATEFYDSNGELMADRLAGLEGGGLVNGFGNGLNTALNNGLNNPSDTEYGQNSETHRGTSLNSEFIGRLSSSDESISLSSDESPVLDSDEEISETRPIFGSAYVRDQATKLPKKRQRKFSLRPNRKKNAFSKHEKTEDGRYKCTKPGCTKTFPGCSSLARHVTVDHNHVRFHCPEEGCGGSFKQMHHLKRHIRNMHTDERPYPCHLCEKRFKDTYTLQCHVRIHTGENPYVCEVCGKGFKQKGAFNIHVRSHGGGTTKTGEKVKKMIVGAAGAIELERGIDGLYSNNGLPLRF